MKSLLASKKGDFEFSWIFAIIAGASILVLAIYGAVQISQTERYKQDVETAKQVAILTNPMSAGFAEGAFGKITFPQETKIKNTCYDIEFGENELSVSSKGSIGKAWSDFSIPVSVKNKYLFSGDVSGKTYYLFSKQFNLPYKISDLIFMTTGDYCFIEPPKTIQQDLSGLRMDNVKMSDFESINSNCSENALKVCFGASSSGCDINVYGTCMKNCQNSFDEGYIINKNNETMKYIGNLVYAGIFSNKENYDCNVKRLLYRAGKIAEVYSEKVDYLKSRGCSSTIKPDLNIFSSILSNATASNLIALNQLAKDIENKQDLEMCQLW